MKKKILLLFIILCCFVSYIHSVEDIVEFDDGGKAYIPQINGQDDLTSVRIEYANGDVFFGEVDEDIFPVYGSLNNYKKNEFYTGGFDGNEKYSGKACLDTPGFHYEGNFLNGKKHGFGILTDKRNNTIYEGNFLNDKKSGNGKEYSNNEESQYSYEGNWEADLWNGQGVYISPSGEKFEGVFKKREFKSGKEINLKGDVYNSDNYEYQKLSDGKLYALPESENCTYISSEGCKYSGAIKSGKYEGYGSYTDIKGNTYEGSFSGNQRSGIGQQVYSDGSVYTGNFFGNQRNGLGSFEFSNGMEYEGGFLDGFFYGTGYLSAEENEEITIIASDEWDGLDIPENADASTTSDGESLFATVKLPKSGKILFSNGDMWEGFMSNGAPVAGFGIWTTQEERIARMNRPDSHVVLAAYQLNNKNYDLSSVYDAYEVSQIINSETYLVGFNDFYKKHRETINKVVGGLQTLAAVLTIIPSPIQPIAAAVDIGLSVAQISLKTASTSIDIYDACVAGNKNLIPGMLKDYGKSIAWDAVNIILATPGSGQAISKIGSKAADGMGKAGRTISQAVGKAVEKNQTLAHAATHLAQLGKVGKGAGRAFVEAAGKTKFFQFVSRNGGRLTRTVKTGWIRTVYPKLFAQYGDDATKLIFKYGNDISEQLAKNGDVIINAIKANKNDLEIARLFLKNGDEIAKVARASEYPNAVIRYIRNSGNIDDAIRFVNKNPVLGKIVSKYGDDAIKILESYGDNAISLFDKYGDDFLKVLKKTDPSKHDLLIRLLQKYPDDALIICRGKSDAIIYLIEKAGPQREKALLNVIRKNGDEVIDILNKVPKKDFRRTVDFLDTFDIGTYKKLTKNGNLPEEITSQIIKDAKNNEMLRDSISGRLKNPKTGEPVGFVSHEKRYLNPANQELKPNCVYKTGEGNYYYMTDEYGRIRKGKTSKLKLQEDIRKTDAYKRDPHNSNTPSKKIDDDAGHVIANRFGGSGELDNLVSQNGTLNKSKWKTMENKWVDALKNGSDVEVEIDIIYQGASKRPSKFVVTQIIDGEKQIFEFLN